mmetsp:Transcript_63123/g.71473  ORF Transcript_63123/g.71473 Transcript_63123/m.71473 type:complete len:429 (+) Transcript_63123:65-1351(+)
MATATPNYNTITIKDGHVVEDSKRQDKKEGTTTTFLQTLFRNKLLVTVIGVVVFGSVVFMTTSSAPNQVANSTTTTTSTSLLRVNGQGGGITDSGNGNDGMSRRSRKPIKGTKGTCTNFADDGPVPSSSSSSLTVMTFNTFLIYCAPFGLNVCEEYNKREKRIPQIADWFQHRDEDVVLMQEIWSLREEVVSAMTKQAGYCHYTIAGGTTTDGSGLAIFSKYEIVETDFIGFGVGSWSGWGVGTFTDAALFNKGVLYAKIRKGDGQFHHIFNTQTLSDTFGDQHYARVLQYKVMDDFIRSKAIPQDELVIIGGDMNEDKHCQQYDVVSEGQAPVHVCEDMEYYQTMLKKLSVVLPPLQGNLTFTYTSDNTLVDPTNIHYNQLLDFVLYRDDYLIPNTDSTTCTILHARDPAGNDLSDHEAMTCEFQLA